jgi:hypothetical protein
MIVNTQINASERNRPRELQNEGASTSSPAEGQFTVSRVIEPNEVAERVVQGIRDKALYILTHVESREILRRRGERLDKAAARFATA